MTISRIGAVVHFNSEVEGALQAGSSFSKIYGEENLIFQTNNLQSFDYLQGSHNKEVLFARPYKGPLQEILKNSESFQLNQKTECLINHFMNIKDSLEFLKTEFVLWFHPDHKLVRAIPASKLDLDLEQNVRNKYSNATKYYFEEVTKHSVNMKGYGIPSYHRRVALLRVVDFLIENRETIVTPLIEKSDIFVNDDVIMPLTHELLNLTIGNRRLTRELLRKADLIRAPRPSIIHQVKIADKLP
jgi:hypothetical protein